MINSKDDTAEIHRVQLLISKNLLVKVQPGEATGNHAFKLWLGLLLNLYFLVYDADNQPNSDAVIELVHAAETTENAAGAVDMCERKCQSKL